MTCEICGNVDHSGNDCLETREEAAFINNGFRQLGNNGWNNQSRSQGNLNYNSNYNLNQPSFKDLVLGQVKINENITKKLMSNDKMLENINSQIEGLTSAVKNQLSFNKMIGTQFAQIVAAIPVFDSRKIPGQFETSLESVKMVSTRFGKSLCRVNYDYLLDPTFIAKKEDLGRPTITFSIGPKVFDNAFCDLGANINIMSKVIYDKILGGPLTVACFFIADGGPIYMESRGISQEHLGKNSKQLHPHGLCCSRYGPQ
jgi:hypothetical protein